MNKDKAISILLDKLEEWELKPKLDGYEYEKSFSEVMYSLNAELLQLSVGDLPKDRNAKKSSDPVWSDRGKKGS